MHFPHPTRQFRALVLVAVLSLLSAACGGSSGGAEESTSVADPVPTTDESGGFGDLRVVMILDGPADDGGYNTTQVRALDKIEAAFPGLDLTYVESVAPGQAATNAFQDAVDGGADVVIGTTFYQDDVMGVAAENLDVTFLTWAGFTTAENVGHFDAASEDGRYLDGLVAGSLTETGTIGYPVGFPFNEVHRSINAFTIGVREIRPDAEVRIVYVNTWFDPALEQQAAEALVNAGADVIAHEVGSSVYATVMAQNDGYVIGYTNDWSELEPDAWASSFLFDWGDYYVEQIQSVVDGEFEPEITYGGLKDGFIDFAPYGPDVSDEILALIEERKQGIIDGTFDIFAGPIMDNEGNEVVPAGATIEFEDRFDCCQWLVDGVVGQIPQ